MDREAWHAVIHGVAKSQIWLSDWIELNWTHTYMKWSESHSLVSNSLWPHGLYSSWNFPGQYTGVYSHFLLQGIFPILGSNPHLPHCGQILYLLSHQQSPRILDWVASPFQWIFQTQESNWGLLYCRFFSSWATKCVRVHKIHRLLKKNGPYFSFITLNCRIIGKLLNSTVPRFSYR